MAQGDDPLARAFARVGYLISLVKAERARAAGNPLDQRLIDMRIVELGSSRKDATKAVATFFDDVQFLLEHLAILDLASTFEMEALKHLRALIGDARNAVRLASKDGAPWRDNIVKDSFQGLDDIFKLLSLGAADHERARLIKEARNNFSHGTDLRQVPRITTDDAIVMLRKWLGMLT